MADYPEEPGKGLMQSTLHLEDIIDFLPDMTFVIDLQGRVQAWNHAMEEVTGVKKEDILGKGDYEYALPFYGVRRPILIDLALKQGEAEKNYREFARSSEGVISAEWHGLLPNGREVYLWGKAAPLYDSEGKIRGSIEAIRDISTWKQAERAHQEAHNFLKKIINTISDPVFVKNRNHRWVMLNEALCRLVGHSYDELIGKSDYDFFPAEEADVFWQKDEAVFATGQEVVNRETITDARGVTFTIETKKTLYTDVSGDQFIVGIIRDITTQQKNEEHIRASLKEKIVMLKEIHHRVKNNMQLISSIISLRNSSEDDARITSYCTKIKNRIRSMAIIHNDLYGSEDLSSSNFGRHLYSIAMHLQRSFADYDIEMHVETEELMMSIDNAIPCGLIVNELISNAVIHGFGYTKKGVLQIGLHRAEDGMVTLVVGDDGIGFPEDLDFRNTQSTGLQLVTALVDQIDGTIELTRGKGTTFTIHFMIENRS